MTAFEQAWSLLKGNPRMHDGTAPVQPAAMNYGYSALMAEIFDERDKRGRYPSSYVDEGKSHLRPRLDVGERAADIVQESPYLRERGKINTREDMRWPYPDEPSVDFGIQRTPRDEPEHPNKPDEEMMHTGEQQ
tara:strand:- start:28 stop:429 length:402 start_codon:yes stop_codon:yes gene_type:complete